MAAYKKDINLFKAAGGERAKSKKMATSKKLVFLAVIVFILMAGGIAALMYFNNVFSNQLAELEKKADNYEQTSRSTRSLVNEYADVQLQMDTALLLEYQSMLQAGFSSDLSANELKAVRELLSLESTGFSIDNHFDDVVDDVLSELNLVQYRDESTTYANDVYNAKFLYGALSYMKELQPIFSNLPQQTLEEDEEPSYWYCYYRGKFVMMLRSTGGTDAALAEQMQNPVTLGCAPFCSLQRSALSQLEPDFAIYSTVTLTERENTSYVIMAITCKTLPERFIDCVEEVFSQQTDIDYSYTIGEVEFDSENGSFSVSFTMNQSIEFRLKDVCDAVVASPFFDSRSDYAYETSDSVDSIQKVLVFAVNNEAVNATYDDALNFFVITEEEPDVAQGE